MTSQTKNRIDLDWVISNDATCSAGMVLKQLESQVKVDVSNEIACDAFGSQANDSFEFGSGGQNSFRTRLAPFERANP